MEYRLEEAYALIKLGDHSKAEEILREYLKLYTSDTEAWYLMGWCQSSVEDAVVCFQKAQNSYNDFEKNRANNLMHWFIKEQGYEYQQFDMALPEREEELKGSQNTWYREIKEKSNSWWNQDKLSILGEMGSLPFKRVFGTVKGSTSTVL